MKKIVLSLCALCIPVMVSPACAHEAHEHGAAKVDIAVDGAWVGISLESPLSNFLPFEHTPATAEQRRQVQEMARRMRRAETLFRFSLSAQCRLEKMTLVSAKIDDVLLDPNASPEPPQGASDKKQGGEEKKAAGEEHGDLEADFTFFCSNPENLNSVEALLFTVWPKLKKIDVRIVTPKGQHAAALTAEKHTVSW